MLNFDFCSVNDIMQRRKSLRRELSAVDGLRDLRVAVLGGSTTDEFVNFAEILLLASGFRPVFYQSEFGRYYEDAVHDPQSLIDFKPNLAYVHTSCRNVRNFPPLDCTEEQLSGYVDAELDRFKQIWDALEQNLGCQVIQNNFETPPYQILGNMDAVSPAGQSRFLMELNIAFAVEIGKRRGVVLQDVHGLSAQVGVRNPGTCALLQGDCYGTLRSQPEGSRARPRQHLVGRRHR